jgi:hypothetical protein
LSDCDQTASANKNALPTLISDAFCKPASVVGLTAFLRP